MTQSGNPICGLPLFCVHGAEKDKTILLAPTKWSKVPKVPEQKKDKNTKIENGRREEKYADSR